MNKEERKARVQQLKEIHQRLRGFPLSDEAILENLRRLEAEKTMKFIFQNVPNFPEQMELIDHLEEKKGVKKKTKKKESK